MVEVGKVILYNNKKYIVVRLIEISGTRYGYFSSTSDENDFFFGKFIDDKLIEVTDSKTIKLLLEKM
jgi:hypothetical protein